MNKFALGIISIAAAFTLSACSENQENAKPKNENEDHAEMDHSSSGEIPDGLTEAENPTYKVGSTALIKDGHMEGMEGAEATIVGAYDTIAYVISYSPTNGSEKVEDHKWIIHEEIPDAGEEPLEPGTEIETDAAHMKGMEGATVEIVSAETTTVYMIDYTPTNGGEEVTNHKWVTEDELEAVK
ncbi:YdhK family protein [Cytobacillus purgationiresistens]|uniref:DUF1541 domain-containing protein n=1 Tax=Cytobacillus purgationiresistens TaxID=863449 RepID=A0ABU0AP16_9BACI|nr:YdhK family protein [Cytobacillus purgationiresistens]MDQ0272775.1 hypothetical protein [Cytobacillus purgationiresistens]